MSVCVAVRPADLCTIAVYFFTFSTISLGHSTPNTVLMWNPKAAIPKARFRKTIRHILYHSATTLL